VQLSKRERNIAIATAVVIGLIGFYQLILNPLLTSRADALSQLEKSNRDLKLSRDTIDASRRMARDFAKVAGPAIKREAPEAEGQVLNSITQWARESNLALSSVKAEPGEKEKGYQKITFRAAGTGGMLAISQFLFRIETASIPVRVADIVIQSHKEGIDDLEVRMSITTIYAVTEDKPAKPPGMASAYNARENY